MGGGARAAYQVGVVRAIHHIAHKLKLKKPQIPFPIICGSSAGAINAAVLASHADDFQIAVKRLCHVWENFEAGQVYRSDTLGVMASGARWIGALSLGWALHRVPRSLFDNTPLAQLLRHSIRLDRIPAMLNSGALEALAVTALSYSSGRHFTFYQAAKLVESWKQGFRVAQSTPILINHLLASSAITLLFPSVPLYLRKHTEYFGDGSVRQMTPLSPAIHFGATRILVIGPAQLHQPPTSQESFPSYPSLAQIGGQALTGVFLDGLVSDLDRLQQTNKLLYTAPPEVFVDSTLRPIDVMVITPSERIENIAARHIHRLPRAIRTLLAVLGAHQASGASFASYLLFQSDYTKELMALGEADTQTHAERIANWLEAS